MPIVGRGLFDEILEDLEVEPLTFIQAMLLTGASNWGQIESFLMVEEDGEPAGACAAFLSSNPDCRPITPQGLGLVTSRLAWSQDRSRNFWKKYVSRYGMFGDLPHLRHPAPYVLEYTGVKSEKRGQGLLHLLLDAHARRAREAGHRAMAVSAVIGNESALRGYTKFGFRFVSQLGPEKFGNKHPGMNRLIMDL